MYIIYGTPGCGFCVQAKRVLEQKGIDYSYVDLADTTPGEQAKLMEIAGKPFRTVPQIFHKGFGDTFEYVGGFTEMKAALDENSEQ